MTLDIQSVSGSQDLFATLRRIDISVPARTDGRETCHAEIWTMCHLLSTLANAKLLSYPLSVNHRDKPDFLIHTRNVKIGVEITEAISTQFAKYCALAEREFPDAFIEPSHFRWGATDLTTAEMRQMLRQSRLTSDGWAGNRPEQEWALFIQSVIDTKLEKLRQRDFNKFDQNWLSVYDNLPLPNVHLEDAMNFLRPLLEDRWSRAPYFHTLFVERGPLIVKITASGTDHLTVNDLWE